MSGTLLKPYFSRQVKQKQQGVERKLLPTVEVHHGGKWIVIDSGKVIIHDLDEKVRAHYNLESIWTTDSFKQGQIEDLDTNNSKKPIQRTA